MERIEGLPDSVDLDDPRISFHVGMKDGGGLQLIPANLDRIVREGLDNIAKSFNPGNIVRNVETYSVTGAITSTSFGVYPGGNYSQADYYNSGLVPISIRIKTVNNLTSGDIYLAPGRTFKIGRHKGFEAYQPDSAPTLLEVIEYE